MACCLDGAKPLFDQCWNIVNWTLKNKLQRNLKRNSSVFVQENAFENGVCEMASVLFRPQCVNNQFQQNSNQDFKEIPFWWLSERLQYVYSYCTGDITVLCSAVILKYLYDRWIQNCLPYHPWRQEVSMLGTLCSLLSQCLVTCLDPRTSVSPPPLDRNQSINF